MNKLSKQIQAVIFYKGGDVKMIDICKICSCEKEDVLVSIAEIRKSLEGHGIILNEHEGVYSITTSPDVSDIIEKLRKDEVSGPMSSSALETLSIILYQSPIRKSDIDFIRGVNSQFILRNLLARGLISRVKDTEDERTFSYKPTLALLEFLGISNIKELPDYESIKTELTERKSFLEEMEASPEE
jgi:segregation and condensation protein B